MRSKLMFCLIFNLLLSGCGGWIGARAPVEDLGTKTSAMGKSSRANGSPQPSPTPSMQRAPDEASEALFQTISALGVDYRYGGSSHVNGFDCSGLVAHVFRTAYGIQLPRHTQGQSEAGIPIDAEALQAGDLVFYNTQNRPFSHVGIYIGDGRFIHAPRSGAAVRIERLSSQYWSQRWNGARRVQVTRG